MGMAALGIGPGDEVILADTNWIASVAPVTHLGATPVFVDILRRHLVPRPGAGGSGDHAAHQGHPRGAPVRQPVRHGSRCWRSAERHGIAVIEDAAEAIGSVWHGRRAGSMGAFGAFSFHGTKTLTTGEGGMFVTDDDGALRDACSRCPIMAARAARRASSGPMSSASSTRCRTCRPRSAARRWSASTSLTERKRAILARYQRIACAVAWRRAEPRARRHRQRRLDADGGVRAANRRHARTTSGAFAAETSMRACSSIRCQPCRCSARKQARCTPQTSLHARSTCRVSMT